MNYVDTIVGQLQSMAESFVTTLPSLVIALIVLIITWLIAKFAVRIADAITGKSSLRPSLKNLIDTLVKLAIWLVGLMLTMIIMLPGFTPTSLIAGLGIGAVAIGFAFQDIFENFLAGVLIMLREKMRNGDIIECEGITGKVEHITLRETYTVSALSNTFIAVKNENHGR